MQRVAEVSGAAFLDHETHLSVHPTFGPWIAWRAVIVLDLESDATPWVGTTSPGAPAGLVSESEIVAAREALQVALAGSNTDKLCEELHGSGTEQTRASWRRWLALREVLEVGKEHRYSEDQAEYHYTKNTEVLERAIAAASSPS
ncbi:hypothetical protein T484DRAFT_2722652 [Baffinella frigidus]|nr:hypothetical protein T484DRAFT_2722652 [Cryptophyta sp. CCMP2293]